MAATAYASLVSLLNTMNDINIHPFVSTFFEKYPMKTLGKKVEFFLDFVENHQDPDSVEAEDLFTQIADVVRIVEDGIEVEAADRVRYGSAEQSLSFLADLHKRMEELDVIKEKVIQAKEETGFKTGQLTSSMPPPSSSDLLPNSKTTTMVGFDGYMEQLLDQLTGYPSDRRKIIPIVGMGGIGKTTLALKAYENSLTLNHFDIRAWVTVSQEYTTTKLLSEAISCLGRSTVEMNSNDVQLGEKLSKTLYGRRYLMVLDDMWSVDAWEKIMFYFPENNNGSRIVITTRQSQLVDYFGSSALSVNFLNHKYSWELFCEKAFAEQSCPPELEEVGKKIVDKCKGLPLTIIVIAGLLRQSSGNREYWEEIAKDKSLILDSGEGNEPLSILYLSYKHLPICLRPCLLYFGLLPEDYETSRSELIKLWVAEGFVKQKKDQCLEDVAESHLEELISRNLLLVSSVSVNKLFFMCRVHDLVRDLCAKVAKKENLFCVQRDIDGEIIINETVPWYCLTSTIVRPLVFHEQRSRLMRVLLTQVQLDNLGFSLRQVNLRYLNQRPSLSTPELPLSISLLWSLQTLIISLPNAHVVAPHEIWKMPLLRHIKVYGIYIPDPTSCDDALVLRNLQTLKKVRNLNFTNEVCQRIPNVKALSIAYGDDEQGEVNPCYNLHNVGCLYKLESLRYQDNSWRNMKLPSSLKVLTLKGCKLVWSDMVMISLLPNLEILYLMGNAVVGEEWNCVVEGFPCLKYLQIEECDDLILWNADRSNFPVLERLDLWGLSKLEEIPSGIGEIPTLESISMFGCNESANISAIYLLEEQESLGNESLILSINLFSWYEAEMLRDKITELGITCQNLWINNRQIQSDD